MASTRGGDRRKGNGESTRPDHTRVQPRGARSFASGAGCLALVAPVVGRHLTLRSRAHVAFNGLAPSRNVTLTRGASSTSRSVDPARSRYQLVSGAENTRWRSSRSRTTVAVAGNVSTTDSLSTNSNSGFAIRFASQSRRCRPSGEPSADGVPQMYTSSPILVNQISVLRREPVLAPRVTMSTVRS